MTNGDMTNGLCVFGVTSSVILHIGTLSCSKLWWQRLFYSVLFQCTAEVCASHTCCSISVTLASVAYINRCHWRSFSYEIMKICAFALPLPEQPLQALRLKRNQIVRPVRFYASIFNDLHVHKPLATFLSLPSSFGWLWKFLFAEMRPLRIVFRTAS